MGSGGVEVEDGAVDEDEGSDPVRGRGAPRRPVAPPLLVAATFGAPGRVAVVAGPPPRLIRS